MTRGQNRLWLFRLGQLACLGFTCLLGLVDVIEMPYEAVGDTLARTTQILLTIAAVVIWLPSHRAGSRLLPSLTLGLGALSLALTGVMTGVTAPNGYWGTWGLSESFGMFLVLLVTTRRGRTSITVAAIAMIVPALIAQPLRVDTTGTGRTVGLLLALLSAVPIGAGTYLRHLDDTRERQLAQTRQDQRAEFARDLHDFIAHHVTGIVVQAQGARLIAERDPARAAAALEQIERAGAEAMTAMRRMVGVLRDEDGDAPLTPLRTITDLEPLTAGFTAAGGPPVRLHVDGDLDRLPVHVSTSAHRVVMEALTNIRQHARGATAVDVTIQRTADWLLLTVTDNAPHPRTALVRDRTGPARERTGYGLAGLGERIQSIGGHLRAGPGVVQGWAVDVRLPLREPSGA